MEKGPCTLHVLKDIPLIFTFARTQASTEIKQRGDPWWAPSEIINLIFWVHSFYFPFNMLHPDAFSFILYWIAKQISKPIFVMHEKDWIHNVRMRAVLCYFSPHSLSVEETFQTAALISLDQKAWPTVLAHQEFAFGSRAHSLYSSNYSAIKILWNYAINEQRKWEDGEIIIIILQNSGTFHTCVKLFRSLHYLSIQMFCVTWPT